MNTRTPDEFLNNIDDWPKWSNFHTIDARGVSHFSMLPVLKGRAWHANKREFRSFYSNKNTIKPEQGTMYFMARTPELMKQISDIANGALT